MRAEPLRWIDGLQLRIGSANITNPHCKLADGYGIAGIAQVVGVAVLSVFLNCDQAADDVFRMAETAYLGSAMKQRQRLSRQGIAEEDRDDKSGSRILAFAESIKGANHGQAEAKPCSEVS